MFACLCCIICSCGTINGTRTTILFQGDYIFIWFATATIIRQVISGITFKCFATTRACRIWHTCGASITRQIIIFGTGCCLTAACSTLGHSTTDDSRICNIRCCTIAIAFIIRFRFAYIICTQCKFRYITARHAAIRTALAVWICIATTITCALASCRIVGTRRPLCSQCCITSGCISIRTVGVGITAAPAGEIISRPCKYGRRFSCKTGVVCH